MKILPLGLSMILLTLVAGQVHAQDLATRDFCRQQLRAITATHKIPNYPDDAKIKSESGVAVFRVTVGPKGIPINVEVLKSSGSGRLDKEAGDLIKGVWRWEELPAQCASANVQTAVAVNWALHEVKNLVNISTFLDRAITIPAGMEDFPEGALEKREDGISVVLAFLAPSGKVDETHIIASSGYPDLDARTESIIKTRYVVSSPMLDATPVAGWILAQINWSAVRAEKDLKDMLEKSGLSRDVLDDLFKRK